MSVMLKPSEINIELASEQNQGTLHFVNYIKRICDMKGVQNVDHLRTQYHNLVCNKYSTGSGDYLRVRSNEEYMQGNLVESFYLAEQAWHADPSRLELYNELMAISKRVHEQFMILCVNNPRSSDIEKLFIILKKYASLGMYEHLLLMYSYQNSFQTEKHNQMRDKFLVLGPNYLPLNCIAVGSEINKAQQKVTKTTMDEKKLRELNDTLMALSGIDEMCKEKCYKEAFELATEKLDKLGGDENFKNTFMHNIAIISDYAFNVPAAFKIMKDLCIESPNNLSYITSLQICSDRLKQYWMNRIDKAETNESKSKTAREAVEFVLENDTLSAELFAYAIPYLEKQYLQSSKMQKIFNTILDLYKYDFDVLSWLHDGYVRGAALTIDNVKMIESLVVEGRKNTPHPKWYFGSLGKV